MNCLFANYPNPNTVYTKTVRYCTLNTANQFSCQEPETAFLSTLSWELASLTIMGLLNRYALDLALNQTEETKLTLPIFPAPY